MLVPFILLGIAAATPIRIGLVLGAKPGAENRSGGLGYPRTSDQEVWATQQAKVDIDAELSAAGGQWSLELTTVYAGEDVNTTLVEEFLLRCHGSGVGLVVGAYADEETVLAIAPLAATLGLSLLLPASGLPSLPERSHVVRLWTNDHWQARVLAAKFLGEKAVVLYRDDVGGASLVQELQAIYSGTIATVNSYNASAGAAGLVAPLLAIQAALGPPPVHPERVSFLCHCGSDEVSLILDQMAAMGWPTARTSFLITDRATPTRSVVSEPARRAFAAAMDTRGVLPHIATSGNPAYASLWARWIASGQNTSLFASALSAYDALRIAARARTLLSADAPTVGAPGLTSAVASTANQSWGASGMMALDGVGDLYRALYDEYAVDAASGWSVVGEPIDGRSL